MTRRSGRGGLLWSLGEEPSGWGHSLSTGTRWSQHCWGGARGAREHQPVSSCLVKHGSLSPNPTSFPSTWSVVPLRPEKTMWGTSPGSKHLPHPGEHRVPPPPTCCMITNEITSASQEGAISLLHWVITLYKRPAQLSACPGPYTPGQARTAQNRLLAAGSLVDTASRAGGWSWGEDCTWACLGLRANHRSSGASPVTPQPSSA